MVYTVKQYIVHVTVSVTTKKKKINILQYALEKGERVRKRLLSIDTLSSMLIILNYP